MVFFSQNQDGFQMTSSSYDNGRIFCSFTRSIVADNMNEDRNLTESVYLFLAAGSVRGECVLYWTCVMLHTQESKPNTDVILQTGELHNLNFFHFLHILYFLHFEHIAVYFGNQGVNECI